MLQTANSSRVKVLHLIAAPQIGGAEKLLLTILEHIDPERCEVALAVFVDTRKERNPFYVEAEKYAVKVYPIVITHAYDVRQILQIYKIVHSFRPDVIHTHGYKTNLLGYLVSRQTRTPIVSTVHGWLHSEKMATRFLQQLNLKVLQRFDTIIAVSDQIERVLLGLKIQPARLVRLRNVPATKNIQILDKAALVKKYSLSPNSRFVGFVGRLEPVKGAAVFISAAEQVLKSCADVQFLIAGAGPQRELLETLATESGLCGRIRFLGFVDNPQDIFHLLDLYVLSSFDEGIPLTLLEAMAADVPVVATSVGGVPEVIQHGVNGILVPPGQPGLLAEAVCQALRDRDGIAEKILAARETIGERFSVDHWIVSLQNIYCALKT